MFVLLAFIGTAALAQEAVDPMEPYFSEPSGYTMRAIEYWGTCDYNCGNGVTFGFRTNDVDSNQACARQAYEVLKGALDANPAALSELAAANGPQTLYLIMSDCTQARAFPSSVWHYAAAPNGTGGMIKFHAVTSTVTSPSGETSVKCSTPTAEDLYEFARATRARILGGR